MPFPRPVWGHRRRARPVGLGESRPFRARISSRPISPGLRPGLSDRAPSGRTDLQQAGAPTRISADTDWALALGFRITAGCTHRISAHTN